MSHIAHGYFQGLMDTIPATFKLCFFLVLLIVVTNSISRLRWVMLVMLLGAALMAIHAIMQDRTGAGFANYPPYVTTNSSGELIGQSRFFGIFDDPNDLGQFLITCMPFVFILPKRIGAIAIVLAAGGIWLLSDALLATHSRGALIGVIATVGCLIFMALPVKWLPLFGLLILAGGLAACALGAGGMMDQSARDRVMYWGAANKYFKSNCLFGGGYGMFDEFTGTNKAAHNAFVLCYSEVGLFGYWFWFNLITVGTIGCWRTQIAFRRPKTPEQAYLKRASSLGIASIVGYIATSFFLSRAYVFPLFFLFAVLASIPVIASRYLPDGHPPLIDFRRDVLLTGTLCTLFSVAYVYVTILLLNRVVA